MISILSEYTIIFSINSSTTSLFSSKERLSHWEITLCNILKSIGSFDLFWSSVILSDKSLFSLSSSLIVLLIYSTVVLSASISLSTRALIFSSLKLISVLNDCIWMSVSLTVPILGFILKLSSLSPMRIFISSSNRSEERRVGKEC